MKQHRYEQIAKALGERITSGALSIGDSLPTEAALCKKYRVSRYTAREALRRLREAGLITRRPRAGSTVTAAGTSTAFSLPLSSAADLFRYATDTRFVIQRRERIHAAGEDLAVLGCRRGQAWVRLSGVRRKPGIAIPLCLITVYLHESLAGLAKRLPRSAGAIYPMVEQELGVRIARIDQRIEAVPLGEPQAAALGPARPAKGTAGSAPAIGLRVRRYYFDSRDRLLEVSDSLHAATAFAYEMRLRRD
ncbi:MAG: GntR family transcriptional regulator [Betaproteobacteria bacterium]